ncbi:septation protein SepH [Arthrobacter sp. TMN-37]
MQELRLVGVDGDHLLLSGDGGATFRLPIDEALRAAASRQSTRVAPAAPPTPPGRTGPSIHLTPRDIQARIRSGATAQGIAEESGLDLAHVLRYEGPVRAERDYMAYLAQRVEVAAPLPSHDGYRSAFGENAAQLGEMVAFRLEAYGVDAANIEWDSWRRTDGAWNVVARFTLPESSAVNVGEEPPAQWTFNPSRKTVVNANRWAQLLSELEPLDGPLPNRRLSAVADRVFDFEAEKAEEPPAESNDDSDGLLDVLRSRRGQRLGADEESDDSLAELLAKGSIPAAHPRDGFEPEEGSLPPGLSLAPPLAEDGEDHSATHHADGSPRLYHGVSTETREISIFAVPVRSDNERSAPDAAARGRESGDGAGARETGSEQHRGQSGDRGRDAGGEAPAKAEEPADRRIKPKRSSVPSWDQIVFGTKGD